MPTRKAQLWGLIILSSVTMAIPYAIQGALSTGTTPSQIHPYIYVADRIAWAIRALVEGLVIGYIARTHANTKLQGFVLWVLKLALIGLIAITLGPVLYATSTGLPIQQTMSEGWHRFWAYALASYMPLMVLGAAYAYKTQPTDNEVETVDVGSLQDELSWHQERVKELEAESAEMQEIFNTGNAESKQVQKQLTALKDGLKEVKVKLQSSEDERKRLKDRLKATEERAGIAEGLSKFTGLLSDKAEDRVHAARALWPDNSQAFISKAANVSESFTSQVLKANGHGGRTDDQ